MRTMLGAVVILGLLGFVLPVKAQHASPPLAEMQKLDFLHGRWEGTGKMTGPGGQQQEARVTETIQPRLGGAIVVIEGIGRIGQPGGADERIVHHALGIISYDAAAGQYRMRAYRADGRFVDPDFKVEDRRVIWSFADPRAGMVRYTITINDAGQWVEIGEASRDEGKSYYKFFEMTLDRKGDTAP